jgi:hypothetical protein
MVKLNRDKVSDTDTKSAKDPDVLNGLNLMAAVVLQPETSPIILKIMQPIHVATGTPFHAIYKDITEALDFLAELNSDRYKEAITKNQYKDLKIVTQTYKYEELQNQGSEWSNWVI